MKNNRAKLLLCIGVSTAVLLSACSGTEKFTRDYATFRVGEYEIENNTWGKDQLGTKDLTDYRQCIFRERASTSGAGTYGWSWRWPLHDGHVKAYPEIKYGWKPWSKESLVPGFPRRIGGISRIPVEYDISIEATGKYNLSFDIWLVSDTLPAPENISFEIMVWVDNLNWDKMDVDAEDLTSAGAVSIDTAEYTLYTGKVNSGGWTYFSFVKKERQLKGALDLNAFLSWLVAQSFIPDSEYLTCIELGNELLYGEGTTTVHSLSLSVQ